MSTDPKYKNTDNELKNPASHFKTPSEVANHRNLSHGDKEEALNAWEQDARQLLTASDEGMTASDEGDTRDGVHLDDVVRAKETIAERLRLKNKPSH
jgi:DNA replication initiation complex subunit (GINS family)